MQGSGAEPGCPKDENSKGTAPLKDVTALHRNWGGSQPTHAQDKTAAGKAKARELGEKTFLNFKERRLRFRREQSVAAHAAGDIPVQAPKQAHTTSSSTSVWAAVKSHIGLRAKPAPKGGSQLEGQPPAELLSNPLFDDPTLRLTPRVVLGVPATAAPKAAPQPGIGRAGGTGSSSAALAERLGLSEHPSGKAAPNEPRADTLSAAHAPAEMAALGIPSCGASGASNTYCGGAPVEGQPDSHLPAAPPLLITADADSTSSLHSRAGSLVQGQPAGRLFSAASLPMTNAADGPGGLTILYENQAMRMERVELKSELKLISARLAVLEVRSKSWGRVAPAATKGRSQSAPRGIPRRAAPPQRAPLDAVSEPEQRKARPLQRSPSCGGAAAGAAPNMAAGCTVRRPSQTRPASPQRTISLAFGSRPAAIWRLAQAHSSASFGSRQNSPTRVPSQAGRGGACKMHKGVPSSADKRGPGSRAGTPARRTGVAFGSRANSPVERSCSGRLGPACASRTSSPAKRAMDVNSGAASGEAAPPSASPMPYRNAFIGAGRPRVQRSGSPAGAQNSRPAGGDATAGAQRTVQMKATEGGSFGPLPPPQASRLPACPTSSERWAGPGGRLGRTPFDAFTKRADGFEDQWPRPRSGKENDPSSQQRAASERTTRPSAVTLTAAQLGLTLKPALRPYAGG